MKTHPRSFHKIMKITKILNQNKKSLIKIKNFNPNIKVSELKTLEEELIQLKKEKRRRRRHEIELDGEDSKRRVELWNR